MSDKGKKDKAGVSSPSSANQPPASPNSGEASASKGPNYKEPSQSAKTPPTIFSGGHKNVPKEPWSVHHIKNSINELEGIVRYTL